MVLAWCSDCGALCCSARGCEQGTYDVDFQDKGAYDNDFTDGYRTATHAVTPVPKQAP